MTLVRMILPNWRMEETQGLRRVVEGQFTEKQIKDFNELGYNVYYLPNSPKHYEKGITVDGTHIDTWEYVFVDCDLKDGVYPSKDDFIIALSTFPLEPSRVVDSGNGVHAYWRVSDLDAMSYLRLQRRLSALLKTDEAVGQIFQLMRLPNTMNTKHKDAQVLCEEVFTSEATYTCEELSKALPPITTEDEEYCQQHYAKTYSTEDPTQQLTDEIPPKFGKLLRESPEAKEIWTSITDDRSKNDYRLGHLMFANAFTKEEATAVLVNTAKALARAPKHRLSYATNIVDKIWTYEEATPEQGHSALSDNVADILSRGSDEDLKGRRFPAQPYFDGTEYGFRLTQVIGLCAGVGVGKTAIGLNLFKGFVELNPDFIHMFVSLEMPATQIARRWQKMCGQNTSLHNKVHVLSNYNTDGSYRNLSLTEIRDYILEFQQKTGKKIGCVCLDHIGVLRQEKKPGEYQGLAEICAQLKSFAVATETLFVVQTQTSRDKAGIGDLELFKDAGFGTQAFESYLDFLMVLWQPLKRCYDIPTCPRVTAYKFAKIREKSKNDVLIEDQCYRLLFEQDTETLRPLLQSEEVSFDFYAKLALSRRKKDRKTDLVEYKSIRQGVNNEATENSPGADIRDANSAIQNTDRKAQH